MAIIPIFIHVHEKSDKEIREEMELDARWKKMMDEEREKERLCKEKEKRRKLREKEEREREIRRKIELDMHRHPWQYQILPEGWSIFGQRYIGTLPWDGENPQSQKGYGYVD